MKSSVSIKGVLGARTYEHHPSFCLPHIWYRILIISLISKLQLLYKVSKHLYTKIWTRIFENKSKYCLYRRFKVIKEGLRPYFLLQTLEPVQNVNIFAWNSAICFKRYEQSILYRGLILYQLSHTLNYDCFEKLPRSWEFTHKWRCLFLFQLPV